MKTEHRLYSPLRIFHHRKGIGKPKKFSENFLIGMSIFQLFFHEKSCTVKDSIFCKEKPWNFSYDPPNNYVEYYAVSFLCWIFSVLFQVRNFKKTWTLLGEYSQRRIYTIFYPLWPFSCSFLHNNISHSENIHNRELYHILSTLYFFMRFSAQQYFTLGNILGLIQCCLFS